jgi:serine/threonine protein kinase
VNPAEPVLSLPLLGLQLLEPIGHGGRSTVYRAVQIDPPRSVAVKMLTPIPSDPLGAAAAFQRESGLMASLNHPNIVSVFSCGQQDGVYYIVMEYVPGPPLRTLLRPGEPWPAAAAAPVVEGIAQALLYTHARGILHLDLKPENVLCPGPGQVKITDFGIAVPSVDARTLAALGVTQGTIDYCSPEQRHGLPIDARADLFSLATMAYELLTGVLPGRVFYPACRRNPSLPARVDDVLRRGLARDPDDRYPSVEPFRIELAEALAGPA